VTQARALERGRLIAIRGSAPETSGGAGAQTRAILERIDRLLADAGIDKSRLLTAEVRLADLALYDEHDAAWRQWVDASQAPVRVCSRAALEPREALVEIVVTAARH